MSHPQWQITNGWIPGYDERPVSVQIADQRIGRIVAEPAAAEISVDLHGLAILPAFINGHDNLLATYLPFQGRNWPHPTWLSWDNEIKASSLFAERMLVSPEDLYQLGAYRNILSGSVFVVDHIPDFVRRPFEKELPARLLSDFGIAHSVSAYALNWGKGIRAEYEYAVERGLPFILHIAEGFDRDSKQSLRQLDEMGALGENTVLVHGLSLSDHDLDRIAAAGAHLVWCPSSNRFIYNARPPIEKALSRGINVCLGTDSAMAGGPGMLQSLKSAMEELPSLDPLDLLAMATVNASQAFRLKDRGSLGAGQWADLVIFNRRPTDNLKEFIQTLELEDLFLVVREGIPVYGDASLEKLFQALSVQTDRISVHRTEKLVQRGMLDLLRRIRMQAGKEIFFPFLPVG
ncbi:MAG: amidohydrolase family protein [Leptonema illini]|uniref:Amidohydrolase family protein n=1 Tax=Leptonema illini TaxID=183 RepID=A0A833H264_9LEPT|nr:MAG: amidohydrolase family protein [Leptonema illini]